MKRLKCLMCLFLFILPLSGCGEERVEVPVNEDPALIEEGNPSAEEGGEEVDYAL